MEKLYAVVCMLAGIVFFLGTVLGDIGSAITNSDEKRSVYKHKLDAIIEYLVSSHIKHHVLYNCFILQKTCKFLRALNYTWFSFRYFSFMPFVLPVLL